MKKFNQLILNVVLIGIILFCTFGFIATFEPMAYSTQITWRLIYSVVLIANIFALIVINRSSAKNRKGRS